MSKTSGETIQGPVADDMQACRLLCTLAVPLHTQQSTSAPEP